MIRISKNTVLLLFIFLISIPTYSQYNNRGHVIGPRIPNFNSKDFEYLDTIIYSYEVATDSIVEYSSSCIDTFSHRKNFRELVFKLPLDSIFVYREHISSGQLINSKQNGFWRISLYDFFGSIKSDYCNKSGRLDLYFNDYRLFDASYPVCSGDLILNHDLNTVDLSFNYDMNDSTILMKISCTQDTVNDYYTCILFTDSIEIANVKSEYLDMELRFLFSGEYDRKIIYKR